MKLRARRGCRLVNHAAGLLVFLPGAVFGQLAASTIQTGAPPAWVESAEVEQGSESTSSQAPGGQVFSLFETQVNVASAETFIHVIKEITTETGVQSGANLEFRWDPSFQELILHQVTVQRGTGRVDRLEPAKFRIIQQ